MKNNRGFTLVEVLGVLVILALIFILAFPNVINRIVKGEQSVDNAAEGVVIEAAKDFVSENDINRQLEKYCLSVQDLVDDGYVTEENVGTEMLTKHVEISISKIKLDYELVDECTTVSSGVINLVGSDRVEVTLNGTYTEQGAAAQDKNLNDISAFIVKKIYDKDGKKVNAIDTTTKGIYHIEYSIVYNGIEEKVYRDVKVLDNVKPVITVTNRLITISSLVTEFNLLDGVSATDNSGELLDVSVKTDLALGAMGTYTITYSATDSSGNTSSEKSVVVIKKALADAILKNYTILNTPITYPGRVVASATEKSLVKSQDDDGDTYYFRGNVDNNYVQFGTYKQDVYAFYTTGGRGYFYSDLDKCQTKYSVTTSENKTACQKLISLGDSMIWRIVRINGDETIRLALAISVTSMAYNSGYTNEKYVGYTYDRTTTETDSTIKAYVDNWYDDHIGDYQNLDKLVAITKFCSDTSVGQVENNNIYYGAYTRLNTSASAEPIFTCPATNKTYGGSYNLKVGLLTADELAFSGYKAQKEINDISSLWSNSSEWTMSPTSFKEGEAKGYYQIIFGSVYFIDHGVRPVINLKADVSIISGNGTINKPYVIDIS